MSANDPKRTFIKDKRDSLEELHYLLMLFEDLFFKVQHPAIFHLASQDGH